MKNEARDELIDLQVNVISGIPSENLVRALTILDRKGISYGRHIDRRFFFNTFAKNMWMRRKFDVRTMNLNDIGTILGGELSKSVVISKDGRIGDQLDPRVDFQLRSQGFFQASVRPSIVHCDTRGNCNPNSKLFKCARCNQKAYCNTSCQKAAWPQHKPHCRSLPPRELRGNNNSVNNALM